MNLTPRSAPGGSGLSFSDSSATDQWARRMHLDAPLFYALLILAGIGLVTLYSAGGQDMNMVIRQFLRLCFGFGVMILVAQLHPETLRRWSPWFYLAGLAMLFIVLAIGVVGKGAQRWLDLGPIHFQPSEVMKVGVPMMTAWILAETPLPPPLTRLLTAAAIFMLPAVLVAKQPDLGTALLIGSAGAAALLFAGIRWRVVVTSVVLFIPAAILSWIYLLRDYQRKRILTFIDAESDPLGAGYHIIQSKIAIGSGGFYGKGWLNGTQSHLDFLPERHTDFIFAVFGEEFGLMGALLLLGLYFFIVSRCIFIATQAADTYARLLAGSLALTFLVYVFVNVGMVTGLLPVVGVPLPLVSYGGSSLVIIMGAFGILMSIQTHRKLVKT